jgi:metal-dependent amidase/aminoacylase/carboxypeptidase family protein
MAKGVPDSAFTVKAKTGLQVDIPGLAEGASVERKCIALRTELDALPIKEETGAAYASTGDASHMCGHDGHMTWVLGAAILWMNRRTEIPT